MKVAVISGDVINSSQHKVTKWQNKLIQILSHYGHSPQDWEILKGDSFQMRVKPEDVLLVVLHIKAGLKEISNQLDVRMSIGIGEEDKSKKSKSISLRTGEAYTYSGRGMNNLKKQNVIFKTSDEDFNELLNTSMALALLLMNKWTKTEAKFFLVKLLHPELKIQTIAKRFKRSASTISETLKRAAFDELSRFEKYYRKIITKL